MFKLNQTTGNVLEVYEWLSILVNNWQFDDFLKWHEKRRKVGYYGNDWQSAIILNYCKIVNMNYNMG